MSKGLAVTGSIELTQRMITSSPQNKLHSATPVAVPAPIKITKTTCQGVPGASLCARAVDVCARDSQAGLEETSGYE
jgi:hypothetical protein